MFFEIFLQYNRRVYTEVNPVRFQKKLFSRHARALAAALALMLALSGVPANAATAIYKVTAKKVNVRSQPDTESDILAVLRQGSELTLLESTQDGWLKVSAGGTTGYVSAEYAALSGVLSGSGTLTAVVTRSASGIRSAASGRRTARIPRTSSSRQTVSMTWTV